MEADRFIGVDCSIRTARSEDVEALLALWRQAGSEAAVGEDSASLRALVTRAERPMLVAETGTEIVGSLAACWDGWRGNMYRLAVAPVYRRQAIALCLVTEGERRLREQGARRIAAIVVTQSDPAVGLWRAAGYHADDRVTRFVKNIALAADEL